MRCDEDGSFLLEQHTNLDCSGTGKTKTVRLDECEQDVPPTLYSRGTGLACCADPASPDCVTGMPLDGALIYLDGELCDDATGAIEVEGDTGAAVGTPADWLESGADNNRTVSEAEVGFTVKLGMSQCSDCDDIMKRLEVTLYVHPNSADLCQGCKHHLAPYLDFNPNSAASVRCVDSGAAYSQSTELD